MAAAVMCCCVPLRGARVRADLYFSATHCLETGVSHNRIMAYEKLEYTEL
jgi:hypothetical protein